MPHRETRTSKDIHLILASLVAFAVSLLMLVVLFTVGPVKEGQWFPVVQRVNVKLIEEDEDSMTFYVTAEKIRRCEVRSIRVLTKDREDEDWHLARADIKTTEDGPRDRPLGPQSYGLWVVNPKANFVKVETTHKCHQLWETQFDWTEWHRAK